MRERSDGLVVPRPGGSEQFLAEIWPKDARYERLSEIGHGKGIVFSPDLSVPSNRTFYEGLGFAYFEDSSWLTVLGQVRAHNQSHPESRIEVLILEAHGTNGNGLKLQAGHSRKAARSYLSVGALQENLEGTGVRLCVITACNAGRLFRPQIYMRLNRQTSDPLFLPATRGIFDATPGFQPDKGSVRVVYPGNSALETMNEGESSELSPAAQSVLGRRWVKPQASPRNNTRGGSFRFAVSDILFQMLLHDARLQLLTGGYVREKSSNNFTNRESEDLFQEFLSFVDEVARREYQIFGSNISAAPND
ncbi:MAG TPA: hypothetical protein VM095_13615 [Pyrinomonadaceae bacterium]|nr:hypothetical protein [Pyrinomonadaceae bacterium]